MRLLLLVAALSSPASAADVPFYLRTIDDPKAASAMNENFRSLVGDMTRLRSDVDTIQAVSASSYTPNVAFSSGVWTNSTWGTTYAAVPGSTVTLTNVMAGKKIKFSGSLTWYNTNSAQHDTAEILLNGSTEITQCYQREPGGSYQRQCSFHGIVDAATGTNTAVVRIKNDGGTTNIDCSSAICSLVLEEK